MKALTPEIEALGLLGATTQQIAAAVGVSWTAAAFWRAAKKTPSPRHRWALYKYARDVVARAVLAPSDDRLTSAGRVALAELLVRAGALLDLAEQETLCAAFDAHP